VRHGDLEVEVQSAGNRYRTACDGKNYARCFAKQGLYSHNFIQLNPI